MKFLKVALIFSALSGVYADLEHNLRIHNDIPVEYDSDAASADIGSEDEPHQQEPKIANFLIEYDVLEEDGRISSGLIEVENGKSLSFSYNFTNSENADVNVYAFGGSIIDMGSGQIIADIPRTDFSPVYVAINESARLLQKLPIDLPESILYVLPHIYVEKDGEQMKVGASPISIQVVPPPLSIFNPQFLSIQLFLLGLVAAISYYVFGFSFKTTKQPVKKQNRASNSNEWLPETHIK
ncbi:Irc22 [Kluyveromyces lactis]|nr:Irc22 [Kluyveromyces lactis]